MPIHVKYQVKDMKGKVLPKYCTYTMKEFSSAQSAADWILTESDLFMDACTIDSKQIKEQVIDDLIIVEVNGFPVTEEREMEL